MSLDGAKPSTEIWGLLGAVQIYREAHEEGYLYFIWRKKFTDGLPATSLQLAEQSNNRWQHRRQKEKNEKKKGNERPLPLDWG